MGLKNWFLVGRDSIEGNFNDLRLVQCWFMVFWVGSCLAGDNHCWFMLGSSFKAILMMIQVNFLMVYLIY
jgi:hypothetical protein